MEYDLSMVTKKNKSVRLNSLLSDFINLANIYSEKDIIEYIKNIDTPQNSTYALMFLVESFDDMTKTGSVWVIILNTN